LSQLGEPEKRNNARHIRCPRCGRAEGYLIDRKEKLPSSKDKPSAIPADVAPMTNYYRCSACEANFSTQEVYPISNRVWQVRRRGEMGELDDPATSEPFDLLKIRGSLQKATRKIDDKTIWKVANQVGQYLRNKDEFPPIYTDGRMSVFTSEIIGEAVMIALLNSHLYSAWIRYALVFYDQERVANFESLLDFLQQEYGKHQAVLFRL
jgi:transcriptional regulator NrdR family protein